MTDRFTANVRPRDATGIIDLGGELDGDAAATLTEAYARASAEANRIVLNFEPMTFMNSSGIAGESSIIRVSRRAVELLARARREGRSVHAIGLSDHYRQIFEITRLSDFVTIHPDEESAVA